MASPTSKAPTAANIISSLGVKGALSGIPAAADASSCAGFIPVLDKDGKLSIDFIPSSVAEATVKPLSNVVVVDPGSEAETSTGSVVAPFKTIDEAAAAAKADSSGRCALLLMPGQYPATGNSQAVFAGEARPSEVYIIGIGECILGASTFNIGGMAARASVYLQNVRTDNGISATNAAKMTCLGRTFVGGTLTVGNEASIWLSSEARISSVSPLETQIRYLSEASGIGYDSTVPGGTVKAALDHLGNRKIRVANVSVDDAGFNYDESSYSDVGDSSGTFDLRPFEKIIIDGINSLLGGGESGRDLVVDTLTADTVKAGTVETDNLKVSAFMFGGYKLTIDPYGYLVVADGDTPITPPSGVIFLSDSAPGNDTVYAISVYNGRMRIANADAGSSDPVETVLHVVDSRTGIEYSVRIVDGRMVLDEGSSDIAVS